MDWTLLGFLCFFAVMLGGSLVAFRRAKIRQDAKAREGWRIVMALAVIAGICSLIVGVALDPNSNEVSISLILVPLLVGIVTRHYRNQALRSGGRSHSDW